MEYWWRNSAPDGVPIYEGTFGADSPGYSKDEGMRIAVDDAGNAYIVGTTYGLRDTFPDHADRFSTDTSPVA